MYTSEYLNFTVCTQKRAQNTELPQIFSKCNCNFTITYENHQHRYILYRYRRSLDRTGKKCLILRINMHSLLLMVLLETIHLV